MIAVIDYGMGNLGSIVNMLKKIGAEAIITSDAETIGRADKLILPGVGAFDHGMQSLHERGLVPLLEARVLEQRTPLLGICLGMQLLSRRSEEGSLPGLGWVEAETVRFQLNGHEPALKVPHMGWNFVQVRQPHATFEALPDDPRFYFVHSYHVVCADERTVLATTDYGHEFTSALIHDNIVGVQFHPEKSHKFGMKLLKNFVES